MGKQLKCDLGLMAREVMLLLDEKFAEVEMNSYHNPSMKAYYLQIIAKSLGEKIGLVEYPREWRRFLKRKDCPQYMKEIVKQSIDVYYPKISLPEEPHWVTFGGERER